MACVMALTPNRVVGKAGNREGGGEAEMMGGWPVAIGGPLPETNIVVGKVLARTRIFSLSRCSEKGLEQWNVHPLCRVRRQGWAWMIIDPTRSAILRTSLHHTVPVLIVISYLVTISAPVHSNKTAPAYRSLCSSPSDAVRGVCAVFVLTLVFM